MKLAIVFLCAIVEILAQDRDKNILVVEELMLHHIHDACQADPATAVDHELLHDLKNNIDNPQVGAHMLCEAVGVGLLSKNGDMDLEMVKSKIALTVKDPKTVDFLVKECAIKEATPEKTAINLFWCLDRNGVTYFHGFEDPSHSHSH